MRLGIVGLPELARKAAAFGHEVVTGEGFVAGAKAVRAVLAGGVGLPVVVGDGEGTPAAAASWLRTLEGRAGLVVVVRLVGACGVAAPGVTVLDAPVSLDELGLLFPEDLGMGGLVLGAGGEVLSAPVETLTAPEVSEIPVVDPWGIGADDSLPVDHSATPAPSVSAVPVEPRPTPEVPPVDPWGLGEPDPPVEVPARPAPAPSIPVTPHPTGTPTPGGTPTPPRLDIDDILGTPPPPPTGTRGQVIFVMAGKGGVGKTTTSLSLAQYAAEHGPDGYTVALIDGNRGQGDISTSLRLHKSGLPTIADIARTGTPTSGMIPPETINHHRPPMLGAVAFTAIFAPPPDESSPQIVPNQTYRQAIDHARTTHHLTIVDSQILDATDLTALFEDVFEPIAIHQGGYFVALTDDSTMSKSNLLHRLQSFADKGMPRDRILIAQNQTQLDNIAQAEQVIGKLTPYGIPVGVVGFDETIESLMKVGKLPANHPAYTPVLTTILKRVTGRAEFDPPPPQARRTFWARLRWRHA